MKDIEYTYADTCLAVCKLVLLDVLERGRIRPYYIHHGSREHWKRAMLVLLASGFLRIQSCDNYYSTDGSLKKICLGPTLAGLWLRFAYKKWKKISTKKIKELDAKPYSYLREFGNDFLKALPHKHD